jgi:hypothetical protein
MRPIRLCLAAGLTAAALLSAPSLAAAVPINDNYLSSVPINAKGAAMPLEYHDNSVDTSDATTQPDLFNPSSTGQPLGGAGPETTTCGATAFGKTVWYDFHPKTPGSVFVTALGFPAVVTLYEWRDDVTRPDNAKIIHTVGCADMATPPNALLEDVEAGKAYTVQVGGVAGPAGIAGGPLQFELDFFPDTDGDGILDEGSPKDSCPKIPGIARFGGCPPQLTSPVSINVTPSGTIASLVVGSVPKGAKVVAGCSRCHASQTVKTKKFGSVALKKFTGKPAPAGAAVEVRVTMPRVGSGKYKFGATGKYVKWTIGAGSSVGSPLKRCLHVGTGKIERCS